MIGIKAYVI